MKKRLICMLLAGLALLTLGGCRSAFEREYYYEAPYTGDIAPRSDKATEIRNFSMLKTALTSMITSRTERGEFRFSNYNGNISEDLAAACFEIKSDHPLGAYAVESLSYDTSYVVSYYVANIYISYNRTAEELGSIVYTYASADFDADVCAAVDEAAPSLVIRCFAGGVNEARIRDLVRRHYYDNPVTVPTEPEVEVTSYPADGANSIYDIRFRYGADTQRSAEMTTAMREKAEEIIAGLTETETPLLALEAAAALSERCADGSPEAADADSAYGALLRGDADSKGFALAYRALCAALGIECTVVEGNLGTMDTQRHFWNIITLDGANYHMDVSAYADDPAAACLLSDDALWGRYIWETSEYPVCDGPLSYASVAGLPEEEDAQTEAPDDAPAQPDTPDAPEETPAPTEPPEETAEPGETGETPPPEETQTPEPAPEPGEEAGENTGDAEDEKTP